MELYTIYFTSLAIFNIALAFHRHQRSRTERSKESIALPSIGGNDDAKKFKYTYFGAYGLVMAADWLQGPYIYTLYKDEKGFDESIVAMLFATAFVSAGVTASFVGSLADYHGRRAACLTCCVASSISCLSVLSDDLTILFAGRFFGGLSSTLLYTVFETWMISDFHSRGLGDSINLSEIFGLSVTLSGIVAIAAGVMGEGMVGYTETKTSPFMLAVVCLAVASAIMLQNWNENYGETHTEKPQLLEGLRCTLLDKRILTLSLATTLFEGCMFLFVFFWSPAIKSSRAAAGVTTLPPFGLIFSCFMCAMMMGSIIFSTMELRGEKESSRLLLSILAIAASVLMIPVLARSEAATFWCFAVFEICVGMYFPTMSRLKSEIVDDAVRGRVYTLMRMPLNIFIAVALGVTQEGDAYRDKVFTATGFLLLAAFFAVDRFL